MLDEWTDRRRYLSSDPFYKKMPISKFKKQQINFQVGDFIGPVRAVYHERYLEECN